MHAHIYQTAAAQVKLVLLVVNSIKLHLTAFKCNLTELTTKSTCIPLEVRDVDTYAHVGIPHAHGS